MRILPLIQTYTASDGAGGAPGRQPAALEPRALAGPLGRVHVCSCWAPAACRWLVGAADAHGGWSTARHTSVPTTDLEVLAVPALRDWLLRETREVLFPTLAHLYGFAPSELRYMDLFLVRYTADGGADGQRALRPHRDRSLLSFNVQLSDPRAFDGGGTRIDALGGETIRPRAQGDMVVHSGKLRHAGVPVTRGTRDILVGFVGVNSPLVDRAFLQSLAAKLNVKGVERDLAILRRAMPVGGPAADGAGVPLDEEEDRAHVETECRGHPGGGNMQPVLCPQ